jgi:iron complex outermembrane recepter protein
VIVDLEGRYTFDETYTIAVGAENIFDTLPDNERDPTLRFLGVEDALTSPYGFNGGFWYLRLVASF